MSADPSSPAAETELSRAAFLLVDPQRAFLDGSSGTPAPEPEARAALVATWQRLAEAARAGGRPVLLARTAFRPGLADCAWGPHWTEGPGRAAAALLVEGLPGTGWAPGFAPEPGDLVLTRAGHSAFLGTPLDRMLANLGVHALVLAGGPVGSSLADTAHAAAGLGYRVHAVPEAVFPPTARLPFPNAARAIGPDEAKAALAAPMPAAQPAAGTALLVVDLQSHFVFPPGADEAKRRHGEAIIARTAALAEAGRHHGHPVIWVTTGRRPDRVDSAMHRLREAELLGAGGLLVDGTAAAALAPGLVPAPQDVVLAKRGQSAFAFTPLHRILRNLGIGRCVLAGGAVSGCLGATLREGAGLGYRFTVATDATYPARSPHLDGLRAHARLATTEELLAEASAG